MNRKFNILSILTVALLISALSAQAQSETARMGIKGGVNVSNLYVDDVDDENARIGFNVGIYGQALSTEAFAIQPELLLSTRGTRVESEALFGIIDQTVKINLTYLDLPVLAVFKLGEAAEIHAGGYAGYLLNANISGEGDVVNGDSDLDRDNFKSFDYGLVGGFGLNFGPVQIGARYNYGLAEIANDDDAEAILGDSKNSFAQVYLSFNLNHNP